MRKLPPNQANFNFQLLDEYHLATFLDIRNSIRFHLHDNREFTLDECRKWFKTNSHCYWLIGIETEVIGYFRFQLDQFSPGLGNIGMELTTEFREIGFIKPIYRKFCIEILSNHAVSNVSLRVLKSEAYAISLYESMGLTISGETPLDYEMKSELNHLLSKLGKEIGQVGA